MEENIKKIVSGTQNSMQNTIGHLERELLNIRAGKANPVILSNIKVDYYGTITPLQQVGNVNTVDAHTLSIQPYDKSLMPAIEKSVLNANIGLKPTNNGEVILINIPPLTEDRRKELVKQVKSEAEDAKIGIRNARQDANKHLKQLEISDDLRRISETEVQDVTDGFIKKVDRIVIDKEKEILTV